MKTPMSAPVFWLVLAALADPVAARVDVARLALVVPKAKMPRARRPEDESAPKPNGTIIDVIVAYCLALHGRMARGCGRPAPLGGEKIARYPASPVRLWNPISL
jgi:hypothetical protein